MNLWSCRRTQNTCGQSLQSAYIVMMTFILTPRFIQGESGEKAPGAGVNTLGVAGHCKGCQMNTELSKIYMEQFRTEWGQHQKETMITEGLLWLWPKTAVFYVQPPWKAMQSHSDWLFFFCKLVPTSFDTSLSHFYCLLLLLLHLRFSSQVLKHDYNFLGYFRKETL